MNKRYIARGYVLGKLWGGGMGVYPSRVLYADTLEDLKAQAIDGLDGSLDSGMGFEYLQGARLEIETIKSQKIGKSFFFNSSYKVLFFGELTQKEKMFLGKVEGHNL